MASTQRFAGLRGRLSSIGQAWTMTRRFDPSVGLYTFGSALLVLAVFVVVGVLVQPWWLWTIVGLMVAFLVGSVVFGRRAEGAAYGQIEGQPGAAAGVLQAIRRGWTTTPAVSVTRQRDLLHRAVGRPGVVLVGEGDPNRLRALVATEKRRLGRFVPDAPIYEVVVGDGDDQVTLRQLQRHLGKLPRNLRPGEVTDLNNRLRALPAQQLPVPKGPVPRGRAPRGQRG